MTEIDKACSDGAAALLISHLGCISPVDRLSVFETVEPAPLK